MARRGTARDMARRDMARRGTARDMARRGMADTKRVRKVGIKAARRAEKKIVEHIFLQSAC
jgi:hypothetical protein